MANNLGASFGAVLNPIKEGFGGLIAKIPLFGQVVLVILLLFLAVKFLENRFPKGSFKIRLKILNWGLIFLLFFLLLFNFAQIIILNSRFQKEASRQKEEARPANLQVTQILPPDCPSCQGALPFLEALKKQNVKIEKEEKLSPEDEAAQKLITQYRLEKVPAAIIKGEIEKGNIAKFFTGQGQVENGVFVTQNIIPPYFDLKQGEVLGQVSTLTLLTDSTCQECYPVSRHEQILLGYGVKPVKTQSLDISTSEGRAFLSRYNITLVPTFILEGDLSPYRNLQQIWSQVGTKEPSTSSGQDVYVFRQGIKFMGVYKDLTTGKVVKPTPPPTPTPTKIP